MDGAFGTFNHYADSNSTDTMSSLRFLKPDVIFIFGMNKDEFQDTLSQLAAASISPKAILFIPDAQENPLELFDSSFDIEGIIVATQWSPQTAWHSKSSLAAQDIFQDLSHQLSITITPNDKIIQAYTAVEVAADNIKKERQRSPHYSPERLQAAFQSYNTQTSLWGPISFTVDGQNKHDVILIQRQNQQWGIIYPIQYRTTAPRFPLPVLSPKKK
jgi:ABC-type branched-subunit amino acid transport system substrate-binding protein